ncbi:hypothetical protein KIN20_019419 [Parelaphostrongylus tenuis]|uniref:Uncharacterized protein n=1 Tax=Parelaphostrongylus tenuis TaxID=148309 RepID=A0AAD5MKZ9_PARTN|nr:hypothetical protein KIN20_019419 [Parelaphostrongylus tenuis]
MGLRYGGGSRAISAQLPLISNTVSFLVRMNYAFFGPRTYSFVRNHSNEIAILQWIDVGDSFWPIDNVISGHPALRSFANSNHSTTSVVGCAFNTCGGDLQMRHVFSLSLAGTLEYTSGNPCQNDEDCAASSSAYCESGLCFNAARSTATETTTDDLVEPVIV